MPHPRALALNLLVLTLLLTGAHTVTPQPPHAAAQAAAPSAVTASRPATSTVQLGEKVYIRGQVSGGSRTVRIEFKINGGWLHLATTTSKSDGTYEARVPTNWYGKHQFRVTTPATTRYRSAASTGRYLTVTPRYSPHGSSRAWKVGDARWNPCKVINFKVNLRNAPRGSLNDVKRALNTVRAASGLRFRYTGKTNKVPFARGNNFEDGALIFAWAYPNQVSYLRGSAVAVGGSGTVTRQRDGKSVREFVYGGVTVDAGSAKELRPGFGRGMTRGAVLMHEIGHTVGVEHVSASKQVMYDKVHPNTVGRFGAGDLTGLRAIGASKGCI